eukprot:scaffold3788_cov72-Cylindrotheca_fusiformis.AAC.4
MSTPFTFPDFVGDTPLDPPDPSTPAGAVGGKDLVGKSQPELTILAPSTRKEKNKRATNKRTSAKWANVTWAKILGNSQEQGTRD